MNQKEWGFARGRQDFKLISDKWILAGIPEIQRGPLPLTGQQWLD